MKQENNKKKVGILAFQGGVIEHRQILKKIGVDSCLVRNGNDLETCDALIIPGGESTTIGLFLVQSGLMEKISARAEKEFPVWGTCAGAIVLAERIDANIIPPSLHLVDMSIARNAYGRQNESFHAAIDIPELKKSKLRCAFIRAPVITQTGRRVKVLAELNKETIMIQQDKILATTFHPELTGETTIHEYFVSLI